MRGCERVVPLAVELVALEYLLFLQTPDLPVWDLDALGVGTGVKFGLDGEAGAGCGRGDGLDDDLVAGQGPARQFMEMWENSRCSILFHLLVPGGRWQTVMARPVLAARAASSVFHSRVR